MGELTLGEWLKDGTVKDCQAEAHDAMGPRGPRGAMRLCFLWEFRRGCGVSNAPSSATARR